MGDLVRSADCAWLRDNVTMPATDVFTRERAAFGTTLWSALLAVGLVWTALCVGVYEYYHTRRARVYVRPRESIYASVGGVLSFLLGYPVQMIMGYPSFPCTATLVLSMLIVPLLGGGYIQLLSQFYFRSKYEMSMLAANRRSRVNPAMHVHDDNDNVDKATPAGSTKNKSRIARTFNWIGLATSALVLGVFMLFLFRDVGRVQDATDNSRALRQLRILESAWGGLIILFGSLVPAGVLMIVVAAVQPIYAAANACHGCGMSNLLTGLIIVEAFSTILFVAIVAYQIRNFPDPWGIFDETRALVLVSTIGAFGFVLQQFVMPAAGWEWGILLWLGVLANLSSQTLLVVWWSRKDGDAVAVVAVAGAGVEGGGGGGGGGGSEAAGGGLTPLEASSTRVLGSNGGGSEEAQAHANQPTLTHKSRAAAAASSGTAAKTDAATIRKLTLQQVLDDPAKRAGFEEYLVAELAFESLRFFSEALKYKEEYRGLNEATRRVRAKRLCRTFIQSNGLYAVNVGADISRPLLRKVNDPATRFDTPDAAELFEPARAEIFRLLTGSLERYKVRLIRGDFKWPTSAAASAAGGPGAAAAGVVAVVAPSSSAAVAP